MWREVRLGTACARTMCVGGGAVRTCGHGHGHACMSRLTGTAHAYHEHDDGTTRRHATNKQSNRAGAGAGAGGANTKRKTGRGGGDEKATPRQPMQAEGQHSAEHAAAAGDDRSAHPPTPPGQHLLFIYKKTNTLHGVFIYCCIGTFTHQTCSKYLILLVKSKENSTHSFFTTLKN